MAPEATFGLREALRHAVDLLGPQLIRELSRKTVLRAETPAIKEDAAGQDSKQHTKVGR